MPTQEHLTLYEEMEMNVPVCMCSVTLVALLITWEKLKDPRNGSKIVERQAQPDPYRLNKPELDRQPEG